MPAMGCTLFFLLLIARDSFSSQVWLCGGCRCSEHEVDCSGKGLTALPDDLMHTEKSQIKIFRLDNNQLEEIPSGLQTFTGLEELYVQHNQISLLTPDTFTNLMSLKILDISDNNVMLSNEPKLSEAFEKVASLKILKLKQKVKPDIRCDYSFLAPLKDSLEELYITGTPQISHQFMSFSRLNTLSLGGEHCNVTSLTSNSSWSYLKSLPLKRLSARHCHIKEIDSRFLTFFKLTILKLDLSCNPLKGYLHKITKGVEGSMLSTLLLDNINHVDYPCTWENMTNDMIKPLKTVPLRILSFQANKLSIYNDLDLRENVNGLIYLDVSQNDFGGVAFYIAGEVQGSHITETEDILFYNKRYQLPSLRFIGLDGISQIQECGEHNQQILDCYHDNYLFLEDEYYWDHVTDPDIIDVTALHLLRGNIKIFNSDILSCVAFNRMDSCKNGTIRLIKDNTVGINIGSPRAVSHTINDLLYEYNTFDELLDFLEDSRYLLVNLTTISMRYNQLVSNTPESRDNPICTSITGFPNNLEIIDLSHSLINYIACDDIVGYQYVQNLTCRHCGLSGWRSRLFAGFTVKLLDITGNYLARVLREDVGGKLLGSAPHLEILMVGEQTDRQIERKDDGNNGVKYFADPDIFSYHPNLTYVDLHDNGLIAWNITLSKNLKLRALNLSYNMIDYIDTLHRDEIDDLISINSEFLLDLTGNGIMCGCENSSIEYMEWLLSRKVSIYNVFSLQCKVEKITIMEFLREVCLKKDEINNVVDSKVLVSAVAVVCSVVILAVLILLAIAYRLQWSLKYRWFRFRNRNVNADVYKSGAKVFGSFASSKIPQLSGLMDSLEKCGVKLTCREKDVLPGQLQRDATARIIASAGRIIIFLNKDYFEDEVVKFECDMALKRRVEDIVLVTFQGEDLPTDKLPPILSDLLVQGKYRQWPGGMCSGGDTAYTVFINNLISDLGLLSDTKTSAP